MESFICDDDDDDDASSPSTSTVVKRQHSGDEEERNGKRKKSEGEEICCVCLESIKDIGAAAAASDTTPPPITALNVQLPCKHMVCQGCMGEWWGLGKNTCPLCRTYLKKESNGQYTRDHAWMARIGMVTRETRRQRTFEPPSLRQAMNHALGMRSEHSRWYREDKEWCVGPQHSVKAWRQKVFGTVDNPHLTSTQTFREHGGWVNRQATTYGEDVTVNYDGDLPLDYRTWMDRRNLPSLYTPNRLTCRICFADIKYERIDRNVDQVGAMRSLNQMAATYTHQQMSSAYGGELRCREYAGYIAMAMPCCKRPVCRKCVLEHVKMAKKRQLECSDYPSFNAHASSTYQRLLRDPNDVLVQKCFEHLLVLCVACGRHTNFPLACHYKRRVRDLSCCSGGVGGGGRQFSADDPEDVNYKKFGYEKLTKAVEVTKLSVDGVNPLRRVRRGTGCYVGEMTYETGRAIVRGVAGIDTVNFVEQSVENDLGPEGNEYMGSMHMGERMKALTGENQVVTPINAPDMTPSEMFCIIAMTVTIMKQRLDFKGIDAHVSEWAMSEMRKIREKLPMHDPVTSVCLPSSKRMGFVYERLQNC